MIEQEKVSLKNKIHQLIHRKEKKSMKDIMKHHKQKRELVPQKAKNLKIDNKVVPGQTHPHLHLYLRRARFTPKPIFSINNREKRDKKIERSKLKRDYSLGK